jgi:NAD(P)-dependent dehydrogenase (short-subunit alcohol dehydrogenase family)
MKMPQEVFDLPERVLVTGAAGGIGAVVVQRLSQAGVEVIATDLGALPPDALHRSADSPPRRWISADLATHAGRDALVAAVTGFGGAPLGGIVHVAGVLDSADWEAIDEAQVERLFAINVYAPFFLTRSLLPILAGDASVVVMGSVAAMRASPKTPFYAASKAASRNLAASLALALHPRGIRVNVVAPGLIDTPLTDALNQRLAQERDIPVAQIAAERAGAIPTGRAGTPDEVVSACMFFLSRQSSYCTGTTLHPTGGVMAGAI